MLIQGPTPPIPAIVRRRIANHFLAQHAISAEEAVAYVPHGPAAERQFAAMRRRGSVREAGSSFWLDLPAYRTEEARRRRFTVPIVLALTMIAAAVPIFFYRG